MIYTTYRSLFGLVLLCALLLESGCADETYSVRARLVSTDGIPVAGLRVRGVNGDAELLTNADGTFAFESNVRLLSRKITIAWDDETQELVQQFSVRPGRVYDGDEFDLPDIPVWRLGLNSTPGDDGVDVRWNEDENLGRELFAWSGVYSEIPVSERGRVHVPAAVLEYEPSGLRLNAFTTPGDSHTSPAYLTQDLQLPVLATSDFRGASCTAFVSLYQGGVEEADFPGCPLTDGDPSVDHYAGTVMDLAEGFTIDLGSDVDIDRIVVRATSLPFVNRNPTVLMVAASDLVFEQVGVQDLAVSNIELPEPRTVRYVRLQSDPLEWGKVSEVSVFLAR